MPVTSIVPVLPAVPQPMRRCVAIARPAIDSTPAAMRPLYSAPMIELLAPSFTKKVPMIDVTMQTAHIASG